MQCLSRQKQFGAYSNTQCRLNITYKRQFSTSLHPKTVQDIQPNGDCLVLSLMPALMSRCPHWYT